MKSCYKYYVIKNTSAGSDDISIVFIKLCTTVFFHFWHIVGRKHSLFTPIPKVTDIKAFSDIRLNSILSGTSKIVERVLEIQRKTYFYNNGIIAIMQPEFRQVCSTTALLKKTLDEQKCRALISAKLLTH